MTTIRQEYLRNLEDTYASALFTVQGKMEDYSGVSDPFENFRFAALSAGVTIEQVFLVLLGVKLARLRNLVVNNREANNESVEDTLEDAINYNAILKAYRELKNSTNPSYALAGEPEGEEEDLNEDLPAVEEVPAEPELSPAERLKNFFAGFVPAK